MRTATTLTRPQHRLSAYPAGTETTPAPPYALNETACAEHLLMHPSPESVICMTSCYPPTPEELARYYALPLQRALIDSDLKTPYAKSSARTQWTFPPCRSYPSNLWFSLGLSSP